MNCARKSFGASCVLLTATALLTSSISCDKAAPISAGGSARLRIGYTLHGLNDFTQVIRHGAEDAGKALDVDVEVQGPARFAAQDAIAIFQGMSQRHFDGLVVVPMPGDVWVTPIREVTADGTPVLTANVPSVESAATTWFGEDARHSGMILAQEIRKALAERGIEKGEIVVGICAPGVDALLQRYDGFKKGLEGSAFQATEAYNVNTENTANYGAWENLVGANPDLVAVVGLCSMDLPNLAKVKSRMNGKWVVGGYDLNIETLDAIKAGTVQVTVGQHPYLQGYLPVLALVRHFRDKKPLPQGWIDVGSEVVTKQNVDSIYSRETDASAQTKWYADYIARNFADMDAMAKPLPGKSP